MPRAGSAPRTARLPRSAPAFRPPPLCRALIGSAALLAAALLAAALLAGCDGESGAGRAVALDAAMGAPGPADPGAADGRAPGAASDARSPEVGSDTAPPSAPVPTDVGLSADAGLSAVDDAGGRSDASPPTTDARATADAAPPLPEGGPRFPFGAHRRPYGDGAHLPSIPQAELDTATAAFYDAWKERYLIADCGPGRYYVWTTDDEQNAPGGGQAGDSITVSEAMGYGLVITALIAGHDPEAQSLFDGLYLFFRDHPTTENVDLMAWNQVVGCETAPRDGDSSATDGDLDIAYGLLLADAQWGSEGPIAYGEEARRVLGAIAAEEVHPDTHLLQLGSWVDPNEPGYYNSTRTSDFMPGHLRAFAAAAPNGPWATVRDAEYTLFADVQTRLSPETGLVPDFLVRTHRTARAADPNFLEDDTDGEYGYNACRVPFRVAVDALADGEPRAVDVAGRMSRHFRRDTGGDPDGIGDRYDLDGTHMWRPPDNTLAFVAPIAVAAMLEPGESAWLDALWASVASRPLEAEVYFGNTLKLLAMLALSGNWWAP